MPDLYPSIMQFSANSCIIDCFVGDYCLCTSSTARQLYTFQPLQQPKFLGLRKYYQCGKHLDSVLIKYRPIATLQQLGILGTPAVPDGITVVDDVDEYPLRVKLGGDGEMEVEDTTKCRSKPVTNCAAADSEDRVFDNKVAKPMDVTDGPTLPWPRCDDNDMSMNKLTVPPLEQSELSNCVSSLSLIGKHHVTAPTVPNVKDDVGTPIDDKDLTAAFPPIGEEVSTPSRKVPVKKSWSPIVGPSMSTPTAAGCPLTCPIKCSPVDPDEGFKARRPLTKVFPEKLNQQVVYKFDDDLYMIIQPDDSVICLGDDDCHAIDVTPQSISVVDLLD